MDRRTALGALASTPLLAACAPSTPTAPGAPARGAAPAATEPEVVRAVAPLGFPWQTVDPFLFCVHHDDNFPAGNAQMGPAASLAGRNIGSDFAWKDGWNMYHGRTVPGFPQHPHRGFETVTVVRRGLVDHSDSLGATARYGNGDVQWLTAGDGIVHAEMMPLLDMQGPNNLDLFQLWLNLPRDDKRAPAHFKMFWANSIPRRVVRDSAGRTTEVVLYAGHLDDARAPAPPPRSWASKPDSDVAIITLTMQPGARFTLPAAPAGVNRMAYFFRGNTLRVGRRDLTVRQAATLQADVDTPFVNGNAPGEVLILQGRPIGEPVVQHGPFVMNTRAEIQQAFMDYQRTQFGGWPWPADGPVHPREAGRFARFADGRIERAPDAQPPRAEG